MCHGHVENSFTIYHQVNKFIYLHQAILPLFYENLNPSQQRSIRRNPTFTNTNHLVLTSVDDTVLLLIIKKIPVTIKIPFSFLKDNLKFFTF